uniref:ARAD1C18700p n=1 Tax=Blastobotrys adeninivorans TaxID=409370 RepID=A0A060T1A7_BLAAD
MLRPFVHTRVITPIFTRPKVLFRNPFIMASQHYSSVASLVTGELEAPQIDDRKYRVITLPNKLEALLISDPEADKASAALNVNVGAFADPDELPGLAHFCEHLLFMGTEKYPSENDYNQYLSEHSGYSNAYTSSDETNYFFEVSHEYLEGALDRFAQFFIGPLFNPGGKDREIRAVDSENKKNLQNDLYRMYQLDKSLSNPEHPFHKFSTGNLETLDTVPKSKGIDVRQELLKFHAEHYSANIMKLAVLGRESLDELEKWVEEKFHPIRNTNRQPPRYSTKPLLKEHMGKLIRAKPVMDSKHLMLHFPIPDQRQLYESRPGAYYSHLIGHEGKGSLLQYLKELSLANGLSSATDHICHGSAEMLIDIDLTDKGLENYEQVMEIVFQYLNMLAAELPQQWIYDELRDHNEMAFRFQQKRSSSSTTSSLVSIMQRPELPRNRLLSHYLYRQYRSDLIAEFSQYLSPENFRAFLVGRSLTGLDKKERWYGTEYNVSEIGEQLINRLKSAKADPAKLHLPPHNEFLPSNFDVDKKDIDIKDRLKHPHIIKKTDQMVIWHKKDDTFWIPKAEIHLGLHIPATYKSCADSVKSTLLIAVINDALVEFAYDAEMAGLKYDVSVIKGGVGITVGGFNHKLTVLLERILEKIRNFKVDPNRFELIKEKHQRHYRNFGYTVPYSLIGAYTHYLLSESSWSVPEKAKELESIQLADVEATLPEMLRQMQIEILAFGNIGKQEALNVGDLAAKYLKSDNLPVDQRGLLRSYLLPPKSAHYYEVELEDKENVNSAIEYFLQVGSATDFDLKARLDLFVQIAVEPAFNQLRTKEQLGYVVFSSVRSTRTTLGYRVLVQSERTTDYLESRIDAFLVGLGKMLDNMPEKEFQSYVQAAVAKKLEKVKNLREEGDRYWMRIQSGYYNFVQHEKDAELIRQLSKKDIVDFFNKYISPTSPDRTKLVVHIRSQCSPKQSLHNLVACSVVNVATSLDRSLDIEVDDIRKAIADSTEGEEGTLSETLDKVKKHLHETYPDHTDLCNKVASVAAETVESQINGDTRKKYPEGIKIEDGTAYKETLQLSEHPQPVVDLDTYWDAGSKL